MRLSDNIAGVTILAFGNGAPDIFTSLVSGNEEGIIMFTELIGAGVFVTTMIAGSVAVVKPCRIYLKSLMRDACFYIVTVCWITYVVKDHTIHLWEAFSFVLCYVLFIVVVVLMQMYETREEKIKSRIPSESDPDVLRTYLANKDAASALKIPVRPRAFSLRTKLDIAIAMELQREKKLQKSTLSDDTLSREEDTDRPQGLFKEFLYDITPIGEEEWTNANWIFKFILIIRAPAMFLLQLFIPLVNMAAAKKGWSKLLNCFQLCVTPTLALFLLNVWHGHIGPVPVVPISLVVGTIIGVIVFRITDENRSPKYHNAFAFLGFLTAMLTVYLMAGEVMAVLQCIGHAFSISDAMLGITFLAWGNSIGDMISNIAIAKQGFPRMGYAACFGGPMFNTLLGLGLTYGMAAAQAPNYRTRMRISDMAPGCFAFLLCSLFTTIIYLNITGSIARRSRKSSGKYYSGPEDVTGPEYVSRPEYGTGPDICRDLYCRDPDAIYTVGIPAALARLVPTRPDPEMSGIRTPLALPNRPITPPIPCALSALPSEQGCDLAGVRPMEEVWQRSGISSGPPRRMTWPIAGHLAPLRNPSDTRGL
ncbi:Sodium/potassium/calcium exchanger 6 [Dufourea novaeangliae]|uniref:Sodium/potassium/calcium exchanger 6 n=1 Tax=Dufourea novaeangliae TaxID=178035 RepID=A0A154PQJ4_DUFNO|nr:Sodium/potassium/calcium exchanger 6 [Dufourea novaeangliae]